MEPPALSAEELLHHAGWLRGLARRLVGESHADDVVQETWRTALERPPRSRAALPAWLARVARNAAGQIRRSETARHQREARSARPDLDLSAAAVAERADLHHQLVGEVLALDEPYRRVLLLRWFEEREPAEIAALLGVSAGTVRSQLKRGLERLRERLDRRFGDRPTWIGALAPLAFGRPARAAITGGGALTGGLLMTLKSKSLLPILALLLLVGVPLAVVTMLATDPEPPRDLGGLSLPGSTLLEGVDVPEKLAVLFGRPAEERRGPGGVTARVARIDTGAPVGGARVLLAGRSLGREPIQRRLETRADGGFDLRELPAGDAYLLRVESDGLPPLEVDSVVVAAGRTLDLGTLWLGRPGALEGRVLDARDRPVAGARVRVFRSAGVPQDKMSEFLEVFGALDRKPDAEAVVFTDRAGGFAFDALPPGIVSVVAEARGHQTAHSKTAVVSGSPSAGLTLRLLAGREVAGHVLDTEGAPLAGARVAAVPRRLDLSAVLFGRRFASSDANGRFVLTGIADDEDLMLVAAYAGLPVVMAPLVPDADDITLTLRGGTLLDVEVRASDGSTPVAGADVTLALGLTPSMDARDTETLLVGRTDAEGHVRFEAWPGYIRTAMLSHPDHASGLWAGMMGGMVVPGAAKGPSSSKLELGRQHVVFSLPKGQVVRGRVLDPRGRGIEGAHVRAVRFGIPGTVGARSDETGRYRIVMPFGSQMHVEASGYAQRRKSAFAMTSMTPGEPVEHDVTLLDAGIVTGRVHLADGAPAAGALVRLRNADAEMLDFSATTDRQAFARADGRFVIDGVAPGEAWHALARLPGRVDGRVGPFAVEAGASVTAPDLALFAGITLDVTVRDEGGDPLAGAKVFVVDRASVSLAWEPLDIESSFLTTGPDGRVQVGPLPPGTHELYATLKGYLRPATTVMFAVTDENTRPVEVTLTRGRVLGGRVLDVEGRPVKGASIVVVSKANAQDRVEATSDAAGRFEASGLAPSPVSLEASADGYVSVRLELAEVDVAVDVRLTKVTPAVTAQRAELRTQLQALVVRMTSTEDKDVQQSLREEIQRVSAELRNLGGG